MWTLLKPQFSLFLTLLVSVATRGRGCGLPLVFSFSRFTRCGAEDDYYYYYYYSNHHYIIVTCIHSIFVVRQREQIPPSCYNKGPDSTDKQSVFIKSLPELYQRYLAIKRQIID